MRIKLKDIGLIVLISVIPTVLLWLPFFLRLESIWGIPLPQNGMATVVSNFDGPLYIATAKSLYNPTILRETFEISLPVEYFAAHFPLYPLLIRVFSPIFGYLYSMLFVTMLTSILSIYLFKKFISQYVKGANLIWITLVFALFPARWLIVRSVGSPEPLFIAAILGSAIAFQKKNYLLAGVWGMIAQLTKSPGILLFLAYFLIISIDEFKKLSTKDFFSWLKAANLTKYIPLLLIPISLLAVFAFYQIQMGDFLAYFHSGNNIHLLFPPFQIFNFASPWVGTFWLEEVIYVYLLAFMGVTALIKNKESVLYWIAGIFLLSILFVSHRDIGRYILPAVPFLFVGYAQIIQSREFKFAMLILIIPIFLFCLSYISQNTMPISDWSAYL